MKKYFKNMWVSYVLAFAISYMFFIVEPITMYANNMNNFWFDLNILLKAMFIFFLITFFAFIFIENTLFFVNKKVLNMFNIISIISFICLYIQGNFLAGNLPVLSGKVIDWSKYKIDSIISLLLWLIVLTISIVIVKKCSAKKYIKICGYICLAIIIMLSSSLVTTLFTTNVLKQKEESILPTATQKNINTYSNNENFIIFLLDAVDSKYFSKAIKNNQDEANILKDFTYYPDTMSMNPYTLESVPQILSGYTYENEQSYVDYYVNSMDKSILLNKLYEKEYDINIYEPEFYYNSKNALKLNNIVNSNDKSLFNIDYFSIGRNLIKYNLFRYLPYSLKKYSMIDTLNFKNALISKNELKFNNNTVQFSNYYTDNPLIKKEKNEFKFIHLEGAHLPFTFDKDLNVIAYRSYLDEVEGCLTVTNRYLNYLKNNDIYNNSIIIIMADHGFAMNKDGEEIPQGRQNPILLIKGKNESHKKMIVSNKAISYDNLSDAYIDLLDGKKSKEIFSNISKKEKRRYMFYIFGKEKHMYEYETINKAWETEKMYKTGREFIRK